MPVKVGDRPASSPALRTYLFAVAAAGALVLGPAVISATRMPNGAGWVAITALTILAGCFRLRFASVTANIAIDDTFFIATTLLFGPGPGALTTAAAALLFSLQRRHILRRVLFNMTGHAVSMGIAAQVFFILAGVPPLSVGG
ncbi:MAG TPA: hypothetical protein VKD69_10720, partial [Vicinamibacterales bacterium]|nr:hypothetical protein [Vicinamibacterales bacterium]